MHWLVEFIQVNQHWWADHIDHGGRAIDYWIETTSDQSYNKK